jgi:hypothetical protein
VRRCSAQSSALGRTSSRRPQAGLGNTGNRFIVDLENGKPTVQLHKVLDLMDLMVLLGAGSGGAHQGLSFGTAAVRGVRLLTQPRPERLDLWSGSVDTCGRLRT